MSLNVSLFGGSTFTPVSGTGGTTGGLLGSGITTGTTSSTQTTLLGGSALTGTGGYGYGTLALLGSNYGYGNQGSGIPGIIAPPVTPAPVPTGPSLFVVSGAEDTPHNFQSDDFDTSDGTAVANVKVTALPESGTLTLSSGATVGVDSFLSAAQLDTLVYTPNTNFNGNDSFAVALSTDGSTFDSVPSTVTISLLGTPDAPTVSTPAAISISEGSVDTSIATAIANSFADVDGETLASVTIQTVPAQGTLQYTATGASAQTVVTNGTSMTAAELATMVYTAPTGISATTPATLVYTVTDSGGSTSALSTTLNLSLTDGNDAPTIPAAQSITLAENDSTTKVGAANQASDVDTGDTITYSLGGADAAKFTVDSATGEIMAASPGLDYETISTPLDLKLIATDAGGLTAEQTVTVTVTNLTNENKPVFSGVPTSVSVNEGETDTGVTLAATDVDGDALTYSLTSGYGDNSSFTVNATTKKLSFTSTVDADTPVDSSTTVSAAGDNVYDVQVEVTDGVNVTTQTIAVTLVPTNDHTPTFTSSASSPGSPITMNEGETVTSYQAAATDLDTGTGGTITYSLVSGYGDNSFFSINSSDGKLSFSAAPDHEDPKDASVEAGGNVEDNIYEVKVMASDGTNQAEQLVAIQVDGIDDDKPLFATGITRSVNENSDVGTDVAEGQLTELAVPASSLPVDASDLGTSDNVADESAIIQYAITGGNTGNAFSIDNTGLIEVAGPLDHETVDEYTLTVQAKDAKGNLGTGTVTVTVTDINDKPTMSNYSQVTPEDTVLNLGNVSTITSFANFADADRDSAASVSLVSTPMNGVVSTDSSVTNAVAVSGSLSSSPGTDTWTYIPNADFSGVDTFEISVTDNNSSAATSEKITVTVTVDPVNDRPVLNYSGAQFDAVTTNPMGVASSVDLASTTAGVHPWNATSGGTLANGSEAIAGLSVSATTNTAVDLSDTATTVWTPLNETVTLADGANLTVLNLNPFDVDGAVPTTFTVQQYEIRESGGNGWAPNTVTAGWDTVSDDFSVDSNSVLRFTDASTNGTFSAGDEVLLAIQATDASGLKSDYYIVDVAFA